MINNDILTLKLLLEYEGQVSERALNKAIINHNIKMAELLLEKGAKIGTTSVQNATYLPNLQMLKLLANQDKTAAACILYEGDDKHKKSLWSINFEYNSEDLDDNARMKCLLNLKKSQHVQNLFQQGVTILGTLVGITNNIRRVVFKYFQSSTSYSKSK